MRSLLTLPKKEAANHWPGFASIFLTTVHNDGDRVSLSNSWKADCTREMLLRAEDFSLDSRKY